MVGVASTAPAYSLAATLGFVVIAINGLQAPIITILAFVPMLFVSYGYKEMNYADPDCGTTFTWATRAFGPKTGWMGGWGILAADVLVMASLAQIAGQYVFFLFNADGIGSSASSGWVLLVGILWIVVMTGICYVGIEISANFPEGRCSASSSPCCWCCPSWRWSRSAMARRQWVTSRPALVVVQPVRPLLRPRASWPGSP